MAISLETSLTEADRLDALRTLDQFRRWRSLDDKRYCLCCGKIIDGWQIRVVSESRLCCPTESCESIPMDWVLPPDEVLSKMSIQSEGGAREPVEATASPSSDIGVLPTI